MILNTLTFYLIAGALSLCYSGVMLLAARRRSGSHLLKGMAMAMWVLAAGFILGGLGAELPTWATVILGNMLLLSAGAILYPAVSAFCLRHERVEWDRLGWAMVLLSALPFWYWGLYQPNGHYRSVVYSFVDAAINVRTAWRVFGSLRSGQGPRRHWVLVALFGGVSAWMVARGLVLLVADAPPPSARGANPTVWLTVFWYIVVATSLTVTALWLEFGMRVDRRAFPRPGQTSFGFVDYLHSRLFLLWAAVLTLVLGMVGGASVLYAKTYEAEELRLMRKAMANTDSLVQYTLQSLNQTDTLLHAARGFYLRTNSLEQTEAFISELPFDQSIIDNVYLVDADGQVMMSPRLDASGVNVADRDYFAFHRDHADDRMFIGSVAQGRVTGRYQFRVSRRINDAKGNFAGVVLAGLDPGSFARFYRQLDPRSQSMAALLGVADHRLRARVPEPAPEQWPIPVDAGLWAALQRAPAGFHRNDKASDFGGHVFAYKTVGDLPLVTLVGYSEADLQASVNERVNGLMTGLAIGLITIAVLALLLTAEIRRRDDQDRFMSMLSHELKTPLSVVRMTLGLRGPISDSSRLLAQQSVQDMDGIVERCLQVDRLDHRRRQRTREACQIEDLLFNLCTKLAESERLQINVDSMPTCVLDTQLLRVALSNLMENALKYSPADSVVQVSATAQTWRHRKGVFLSVMNEPGGAGLPDPDQVFKKYYRATGARSRSGSGLGLYLVRGAVRRLGGWVRYAPDAGQVGFEVWVPIHDPQGL